MTDPTGGSTDGPIRKTLGLSGLTLHAMTLVSPGAFVWLVFPVLLLFSGEHSGAGIFAGLIAALMVSFLTIFGLAQLVSRYPMAGSRSGFHFLQAIFEEYAGVPERNWLRILKWAGAWMSHLFYWTYPGILLSLFTQMVVMVLADFDIHPTLTGQCILVICLSALVGFLALRGISGSNSSSILLNIVQTGILGVFCLLLIVYRVTGPTNADWYFPTLSSILSVTEPINLIMQAGMAYFLVSGFQAVAATGIFGADRKENLSQRGLIGLLLQNGISYILQLSAIMLALQTVDVNDLNLSGQGFTFAPISAMIIRIGDQLLGNNGYAFFLVLVGAVVVSLLATLLTAFNTAVRVNFAIGVDPEMPGLLRLLPARIAAPTVSVYLISAITALIGIGSAVGGISVLPGTMLAANLGAMGLYGLISAASLLNSPFHRVHLRKEWPALVSIFMNWGLVLLVIIFSISHGGFVGKVIWVTGCLVLAITLLTLISTFSRME